MPIPFHIGPYRYSSKAAANCELTALLHSVPDNGEYLGEARRLVEAVFMARTDKVALLGSRTIIRFRRGRNAYNTPCFYADLDDGSTLDFSFMKLLRPAVA
jgi:hypothetical protein